MVFLFWYFREFPCLSKLCWHYRMICGKWLTALTFNKYILRVIKIIMTTIMVTIIIIIIILIIVIIWEVQKLFPKIGCYVALSAVIFCFLILNCYQTMCWCFKNLNSIANVCQQVRHFKVFLNCGRNKAARGQGTTGCTRVPEVLDLGFPEVFFRFFFLSIMQLCHYYSKQRKRYYYLQI